VPPDTIYLTRRPGNGGGGGGGTRMRRPELVTDDPRSRGRVLMMLSEGLLNKQIAYELGSPKANHSRRMSSAILQKTRRSRAPGDASG